MDVFEVVLKESSYGYGFALTERSIDVTSGKTGFYIYDVLDKGNGDHSRTMLKPGDRLLGVNGISVKHMTADGVQQLLTQSCQGWVCLKIQPQGDINNDPRTAILKNIPDYEKNNPPSLLKKSLKRMRRIFEQPKGKFTVAVKRNPKKTLAAQILGGSDEQILNGYSGIHVLNIGDDDFTTVFGEETLQIGDRILSVNGFPLDDAPNDFISDILSGRRGMSIKEIELTQVAEVDNGSSAYNDVLLLEANRLSPMYNDRFEDLNEADAAKHWYMSLLTTSPIATEVIMIFTLSVVLSLF